MSTPPPRHGDPATGCADEARLSAHIVAVLPERHHGFEFPFPASGILRSAS
jgi:hypothetical protein